MLPLSYAIQAARAASMTPGVTGGIVRDIVVVLGAAALALALGAATLRRRTA